MKKNDYIPDLTNVQWGGLIVLRILIGWHLLYEGFIKLSDPNWTSAVYLNQSSGLFGGLFQAIAENSSWLSFVDFLNQWILLLAGISLIAGLINKTASFSGMILLLLYYLAQPPFFGPLQSDLIVNMVLIEAIALFILGKFPTAKIIGMERIFYLKRGQNVAK